MNENDKKITRFTGLYPVSKTLRFALRPMGKTDVNFVADMLLEEDIKRAENYKKVKKLMDAYHKAFISSVLSEFELDVLKLQDYADLYYKKEKTPAEKKLLEKYETDFRKSLSKAFEKDERFSKLFKADMLEELLPDFLEEEDQRSLDFFNKFSTYFAGFHENRKNIYKDEAIATAAPYRLVNDNLPKFLDNLKSYNKIKEVLGDRLKEVDKDFDGIIPINMDTFFEMRGFNHVLTQEGIKYYNDLIGGYSTENGKKIQGINEIVNLYNQQVEKSRRLPKLKQLYKQILSDWEGASYIPEAFDKDQDVLDSVNAFYVGDEETEELSTTIEQIITLFTNIGQYDASCIWIKAGKAITDLSNAVLGQWSVFEEHWNNEYDRKNPPKKKLEKHEENRKAAFKKVESFSLYDFMIIGEGNDEKAGVLEYVDSTVKGLCSDVLEKYTKAKELLTSEYTGKKLMANDEAISFIKGFLDSIKNLERFLKPFLGTGKEAEKDEVFYGEFLPLYERLSSVDKLYNKVRNYVTQKPYSTEKIKLNFENSQLLGGWDKNKERDYRTILLRKDENVYLAIMTKKNNKVFVDCPYEDGEEFYEKMEYKLLPGPNKMLPKVFFAKSNIDYFNPSERINEIYKKGSFKKGDNFSLSDCHELIDFYKASILKHEEWREYGFVFKPTSEYNDIGEFYKDVKDQGYSVSFKKVSEKYINESVDKGDLYLFQLYNKDFSPHSSGKPNLHTMYFRMLFDERNLKDVVYQLNGGAEMFYRCASISKDEMVVHHAGEDCENRGNHEKHVFKYDVIKDKRYTKDQFSLHLPITINFKADGRFKLNHEVRKAIKVCDNNYIIGIDRGERNLLYISVIDETGTVVKQKSLNIITNEHNGVVMKKDYRELLDAREKERTEARKEWKNMKAIKGAKEGYLSQAVKLICDLVREYDAIVVLEDLNAGFKNTRTKVEKQIYQKFEKMLIDKLNYLVFKDAEPHEAGGTLHAYQLTNKSDGYSGKQDGFIFFIPPWLTSKIDPVTGFVKLINPRYTNMEEAKRFIEKIDDIRFNNDKKWFEFDIDYSKFNGGSVSKQSKWTICTNGERYINYRNKQKNNNWDTKKMAMVEEFEKLFDDFGITDYSNLKQSILAQDSKEFFERLMKLLSVTLQMRNSETGNGDVDFIISPVCYEDGRYYFSDDYKEDDEAKWPKDADANGAYNIARKGLMLVKRFKETSDEELDKVSLTITNKEWLEFAQRNYIKNNNNNG